MRFIIIGCVVARVLLFSGIACRAQSPKVDSYLHQVYEAEQCIISGKYAKAVEHYSRAFSIRQPFATDIYNGALSAGMLKDYWLEKTLAAKLVLKGASRNFFSQRAFRDFVQSYQGKLFLQELDSLERRRGKLLDTALLGQLKMLVARDQRTHCALPENKGNPAFIDSMHELDDSLNDVLLRQLFAGGYIGEDRIGGNFDDTVLLPESVFGILILHGFQEHTGLLVPCVEAAVEQGLVRPEVGLGLLQEAGGTGIVFDEDFCVLNDTLRVVDYMGQGKRYGTLLIAPDPSAEAQRLQRRFHLKSYGYLLSCIRYAYRRYYHYAHGSDYAPFIMLPFPHISTNASEWARSHSRVIDFVSDGDAAK